jgi:hypothetical protein
MTDPTETLLAICVLIAIAALGAAITAGNERVRRATLEVRDVARDYALADLAMRRARARRDFSFASQEECMRVLEQIALDAAKRQPQFTSTAVTADGAMALLAMSKNGETYVFTPSAKAYLASNPVSRRHSVERFAIDGLIAGPFVIEELESVARWHGLTALPRTPAWSLLVLPPDDYSLLPRQGLLGRLRRKKG